MADIAARVAGVSVWGRMLAFAALGVCAGLGQAPLDLWPATLFALAVVLTIDGESRTARQSAFHLWAFGVGYFGFTLRWIIEPFLVDIARHGWMAPFAILLMAGGLALFWGSAGYLAGRLPRQRRLALVVCLVWAELARSLVLTGFPWALLGHVWVTTPLAHLAAFGGPHLLTLATLLAAWALTLLFAQRWVSGSAMPAGLAAAAIILNPGDAPEPDTEAPTVRLVQPNAPQHQKWDPAYRDLFFRRMVDFTSDGAVPDLVVWPETAIPSFLNYIEADMSVLVDATRGAHMIFGIQRFDDAGRYYNSLVVMSPSGQLDSVYDKRHLVPFGEYVPLVERFGLRGLASNIPTGFTAGADGGTVTIPGIGKAIALICYEGIFAEEIYRGPDRPRLMVLITNDAWFGEAAGPYQHLAQARLRAIEHGLPMVRVANTGVSAMIDAKGRIVDQIPLGVDGTRDVVLPPALSPTAYARWGEWPFAGILILLTLGLYGLGRRNSD